MSIALRGLTILALVVGVLLAGGAADASHSWSTYHWGRTANPFTLALGDNTTTTDWRSHLGTTSTNWSKSSVLDTVVVAGQSKGNCRATLGRVEVCNKAYGSNGWLGLAQIWLSGGHIVQGVAKMNDTYFSLPAYNNWSEKQHVMCQEVGHTFGLGHTSEDGSSQNTCMDYYRNTTDDKISTAPNAHDFAQLEAIYAHLDSSSTVGTFTASIGRGGENGADGDGTPAGASKARGNWYVERLGGGRYLITHITWAD